MIPLTKPYITQNTKDAVCAVLDSGWLTEGRITEEFEQSIRSYVHCNYAMAVTSCTVGLEIALKALKIGTGDEVIVPSFTHMATANAVHLSGAKPVFVDIDRETMLIDYEKIKSAITPKTKAIMPVSLFGNPLNYTALRSFKLEYDLTIIEDAACSLGAEYKGMKVGNLADISVFSFHPRKFITTGEGGMITTNHTIIADWINQYKRFGSESVIGSNYKMSDVLAAIGLNQMQNIHELLIERRYLAANYIALFSGNSKIGLPKVTVDGEHSYQTFCIFVDERDRIKKEMNHRGIEVQIGSYCLDKNFKNAHYAGKHSLALPLYNGLQTSEQRQIVNTLMEVI
jgi:dTDP-4-amino-4,6-dideoxygalactose transaminase